MTLWTAEGHLCDDVIHLGIQVCNDNVVKGNVMRELGNSAKNMAQAVSTTL